MSCVIISNTTNREKEKYFMNISLSTGNFDEKYICMNICSRFVNDVEVRNADL